MHPRNEVIELYPHSCYNCNESMGINPRAIMQGMNGCHCAMFCRYCALMELSQRLLCPNPRCRNPVFAVSVRCGDSSQTLRFQTNRTNRQLGLLSEHLMWRHVLVRFQQDTDDELDYEVLIDMPSRQDASFIWTVIQHRGHPVLPCASLVLVTIKNWNSAAGRKGEFDSKAAEASAEDTELDCIMGLRTTLLPVPLEIDLAGEYALWMRFWYGARDYRSGLFVYG